MENGNQYDIIENIDTKETYLSEEIKESIENHCYSNPIEKVIKDIKDNSNESIVDWDPDFLIFNYVSNYLKKKFPNVFKNKTVSDQLNIIYEAIVEFLNKRDRGEQIPRVLNNIKINNKQESKKTKIIKNKFVNQILSVFM